MLLTGISKEEVINTIDNSAGLEKQVNVIH